MKNFFKKLPLIIIALVLLQTLRYKFGAHPESVEIFQQLGLFGADESVGRIGTGIAELLVVIGLFIPKIKAYALIGVVGLMLGAVYFHITSLGFEGANLNLFISALVALGLAAYQLVRVYRNKKLRG